MLKIKYLNPVAGTIKLSPINIVSTGNNIAAPIDPIETILVIMIITKANIKHIKPIFQLVIKSTPKDVATPFPPKKKKNIGNV